LEVKLGVGFGGCWVSRDDVTVWHEEDRDEDCPTLGQFEDMAAEDPDHDWQVVYDAPLWNGTWQRHDGEWVCVEKGMGFAGLSQSVGGAKIQCQSGQSSMWPIFRVWPLSLVIGRAL